jgi:tetratricopeptide (TPR) repeat protein
LRADPDDADRRPAAMPAKSSAGPVFVLLLAAAVAGAGAYYWQTYLRPPPAPAATSEAADQASPAAEPTPLQARPDPTDEISSLLDRAADDIEEYRLNSPAGNNAVEKYRQVLALSPGNSAAFDGLDNVATRYSHMAQTAIVDGRFDEATRYLKQAEQLAPENVAYLDAAAALAALPAAAATGANASALDPLPPLSVAELLTRAGQLGGPDTVDSGNFRKLAQLYQAVLAQEPEHPEATRGLDNSGRYAGDFAANSLRLGELRLAEVQIGYLQEIDPENERITPLEESLAQAILTRAQETGTLINTADDPASLAAAGLDVSQLLVAAETALEAPYPSSTDPADFRALGEQLRPARHQIEGARRLEPGNPAIAEAEARLGRRYAEVARELIELGDLAGARALLDEANSFAVTGPELAALQHLLASMETGAGPAQEKAIIEQIY